MKVIAICGSPRREGNTEQFLRLALEVISGHGIETEFIPLAGKTIKPCTACMACLKENRCATRDDFDPVYRAMLEADGIIVGSPVYYSSATPELMALLDRAGYVAGKHGCLLSRKVGGPIAVARRAGQNFTVAQLMMWYMINGLIVPGSTYWNIGIGRDKGEVMQDEEGVRTIRNFAENVAWLLEKIGPREG